MAGRKYMLFPKLLCIAVISAGICLNRLVQIGALITDVPTLLLAAFGGAIPFHGLSIFDALLASLPVVAQFLLFAECIGEDLPTVSVYVFSRTRRRDLWLFGKMGRLALLSLLCYCVLLAAGVAVGLFAGLKIPGLWDFSVTIVLLFATSGLWGAWMLCLIAVCCVKNKAQTVISASAAALFIWFFTINIFPASALRRIAPWAPMTHSLLATHSDVYRIDFLAARLGERTYALPLWQSAVYFVFCAAALLFVSRLWIMRTDFTETR
jgi:hypothetical protein